MNTLLLNKSISFRIVCFIMLLIGISSISSCQSTNTIKKTTLLPNESQRYDDSLPPFSKDTIDGILVKVGNESILLSDLNQVAEAYPNVASTQLLDGLIDERVIAIKAQSLGIVVTEDDLTKSIDDFLKGQNLSEEDLERELKRAGKTVDEYREVFKKEIVKQQLIGRAISPFVTVSNDEVSRFYLQQTKNVKQVEKVKLRSLLIEVPENFTGDVLKYELVQKVDNEIKNQGSFVDLVREYSGAQTAKDDLGILPPKNPKELPQKVQEALPELEVNQVVGPFAFGRSVFFFQYLGVDLTQDSDLYAHFDEWKSKLMNQKFTENLAEYLSKERASLKVVTRPLDNQTAPE